MGIQCFRCDNSGWVCKFHQGLPWEGSRACGCGGGGAPCPDCSPSDVDNPPRMSPDFEKLAEVTRDRTNDKFEEAVRRQKILDDLKK